MTTSPTTQIRDGAPGRLGDPARSLATDPRVDPRVVAALAPFGAAEPASPPPVGPSSPRAELLEFAEGMESGTEAMFDALMTGLPEVEGVETETLTITATAGHTIELYVTRPVGVSHPLPCVFHLHGGGMVIASAANSAHDRWRRELAATGLVVVGVEFRNGAGRLGPHPFPAGLDDCADGLRWVASRTAELGISHIVVAGESGGANLALALTIRAKREGFLAEISGVHAQCPHIHGKWGEDSPALPSLVENDGYFMNRAALAALAEVYDPGFANADDATCWPARATAEDLADLPPHVISVNELDPLRDEGIAYHRALLAAGVQSRAWLNLGLCHTGETLFRATMPDVYAATIAGLSRFAHLLR
ncbi:alpha/beta hydrolase fold domain-containing protein [Amycolatopsis sp. NPDC001319]|uniref:alpha/beta hydrolase fold domain-containing protein n=1 Tax=unclassified Amycolatopsis TaxID=2618356 RepID=UPI0036AA00DE